MNHGIVREHAYVTQQLNQRKTYENLNLVVRVIDADSNAMAIYLASHGAENYHRMVITEQPFNRIL